MRNRTVSACLLVGALALVAAGCGSSKKSSSTSASSGSTSSKCTTSIGFEGPITGMVAQLGGEQLHFAQLAVNMANQANGTNITLVQGDTQLMPAQATTVTQQFVSNSKIVGIVGPAGSQEVSAVGPLLTRAKLVSVGNSATNTTLTSGQFPTFVRVVARDDVQGPQDARYIINNLKPKKVMLVDDQTSYSTGLASSIIPVLKAAGIQVNRQSVNQKQTDFSSLVSKVDPSTSVVILPWQVAANGQQLGQNLAEQKKKAVIFGTDGMYSTSQFKIPGSFVSAFGPDISAIPADASIVKAAGAQYAHGTFGPPTFAATNVLAQAISDVCKAGQKPSRDNVLAQVKKTNEPTSILGQPISFTPKGDLVGAKFFTFKIDPTGKYQLIS
jgi:branched-chain amino acid transport system substrate-binding protein